MVEFKFGRTKRVFDVLPTNCKDEKVQALLKLYGYHEQCEEDKSQQKVKISRYNSKFPEFSFINVIFNISLYFVLCL